jgi:hypothetical protein
MMQTTGNNGNKSRRAIALALCAATLGIVSAFAGDLEPTGISASSVATSGAVVAALDEVRVEPRISGTLHKKTEAKLREAFEVAVAHVRDRPECQDLFAQFGTDGLEKLSTSLYYRSTGMMERRVCRGGVSAFTFIGSPQVRLCNRFASLSNDRAAAALVHEALHFAGMTEAPRDPHGPSPGDIDRMVSKACKF